MFQSMRQRQVVLPDVKAIVEQDAVDIMYQSYTEGVATANVFVVPVSIP